MSENDEDVVNFKKYLTELDGVTQEVLQACRADRQEAQDVINMLRKEVNDAINKNKQPSRMFIDGLVKSVEVKAGINATAVKMMDSVAKVLASTKSGINIQNNNMSVDGKELDELLSQDVPDDLEKCSQAHPQGQQWSPDDPSSGIAELNRPEH